MGSAAHDKAEGKWDEVKGKTKEVAGRATGDRSTQAEGEADQVKGKGRQALGHLKNAGKKAKDAFTGMN
jgi:uncharacterized protein YjbJ (UPF0337 family)